MGRLDHDLRRLARDLERIREGLVEVFAPCGAKPRHIEELDLERLTPCQLPRGHSEEHVARAHWIRSEIRWLDSEAR